MSSRALFGLERVWLAADRTGPPFVNQLVVELDGVVERDALQAAVDQVLPAWPAARARLSGAVGWARWSDDGAAPRVVGPEPITLDRGPAPYELSRLNHHSGPIVEWVFGPRPGGGTVLVLRTHHAVFDGRAAWALAEDLGAALRGEAPREVRFHGVMEPPGGAAQAAPAADAPLPTGASSGVEGASWARLSLSTPGPGVLARVLVALSAAANAGALLFSIPVDLRGRLSESERRAAANLTGFVRLSVAPDGDVSVVQDALRRATIGTEPLNALRTGDTVRWVPLWLMESVARGGAATAAATGRTTASGAVSNLGRLDAGVFDHADCRGRACFWIPPTNPGTPMFVTLTGHAAGLELVVGMPNAYGDGGRLEGFLARVGEEMAQP
ncbi:hypothetical protein LBMAG42_00040 [Deltaproteobacteria bacterium]|nr:hypothetical protein LBMAG42_00040 [Deltaproteobacteria bacterium]